MLAILQNRRDKFQAELICIKNTYINNQPIVTKQ